MDKHLETIDFDDLQTPFVASSHIFQDEFLQEKGTSEAETFVSGKADCLLDTGKDKKVSFLE